ncbi:GNAT family N-acetyltransferase [Pseudoduganella umbonata]|uniref:Ribosomal protein S18 acetylase RimI-like enzyme n=1 Tax=Pseudoduganella umbonata TaxID=864828 RepID=A0A7W5EI71_9BURK|nr:GNAT family N-acetyltransferase [Pseudoduganella umbonata]MBB3225210.1 ribosomal protein S18 acetylase RimI-like enzyme [Pseudoduganella umbonata]
MFKSLASFGLVADFETLDAAIGVIGQPGSPNEIELVAEMAGKIAGCLVIQRRTDSSAKLFGFHVDASMQGRGLGRALLSEAIAEAARRGFAELELETCGGMHAAIHLYESFGWKRGPDPLPGSGGDRFYSLALIEQAPRAIGKRAALGT